MPSYSSKSLAQLATCDHRLKMVFTEVIKYIDCSVVCGHRNKADQDRAAANGVSKTPWPTSKHNSVPSLAIDVVPYPVKWGTEGTADQRRKDLARFYFFAGYVKSIADNMNIKIRWGGDWDSDMDFTDQNFDDLPHFELIGDK